jgi:HSP20 family protein
MATETPVKRREDQVRRVEPMRTRRMYTPPVDILEQKDGLWLMLDMPGVQAGDVEIQYENGLLTIHGKVQPREPQDADYLHCEYGTGDFYRTFSVGEGIDADKIEAECRNGVIKLHLPKSEALKPRKIEVKAG